MVQRPPRCWTDGSNTLPCRLDCSSWRPWDLGCGAMIYYLPSTILPALTPYLGGQHWDKTTLHCWVVSLRRPWPSICHTILILHLYFIPWECIPFGAVPLFWISDFRVFALYIYLSLGVFLMVQCILNCYKYPLLALLTSHILIQVVNRGLRI